MCEDGLYVCGNGLEPFVCVTMVCMCGKPLDV